MARAGGHLPSWGHSTPTPLTTFGPTLLSTLAIPLTCHRKRRSAGSRSGLSCGWAGRLGC
jgi:hypothetical protein